jgi:hypothetical protein
VDRENTQANANLIPPYLRQLLGDNYDDYMKELTNYDPTGRLLINGEEVDLDALIGLIQDLLAGKITIENVFIEN